MSDEWREDAACKGQTHIFFAPRFERGRAQVIRQAKARAICDECPVRSECRKEARGEWGIWAGEAEDAFALFASSV